MFLTKTDHVFILVVKIQVVQLLRGENNPVMDLKQQSLGGNSLLFDSCDLEGYTTTTYLKDLNRHMELVME